MGLSGAAAPRSQRTIAPNMGAIVQMPEGRVCVNELQREARQKLFSYAVAALSNFLGLPSESQGLSPLGGAVGPLDVCGSTRVALGSPSGDRMHSESGPGSYKVIGPAHVPAMVPQRS